MCLAMCVTCAPGALCSICPTKKKLTCDMGQLIPIMCDEVVPGDTFEIANEVLIRFQPMVAPIMHEINVYTHYFFVPYRILWDDWEEFITGGPEGDSTVVLPRWTSPTTTVGSLWDYLGFPTGITPAAPYPIDFPRRAYNRVWNEYYRDETLQDEVSEDNQVILNRAWEKDYFTSSLPWRQRGTAPAIPLSGSGVAEFNFASSTNIPVHIGDFGGPNYGAVQATTTPAGTANFTTARSPTDVAVGTYQPLYAQPNPTTFATWLANNSVDLTSITSFDVSDLRLAFQTQKWLERNARAGARYTEFLKAHFGVAPRDARLQRPEYIGGSKSPVIVSEVLQTGSTDATSPQGNMAGHGISAGRTYAGKYTAEEYGCIIGIMSIMPRSAYQQGIDRQWLRETKYDFFFPEFVNLSEQAIINQELYAGNTEATNRTVFGFQGRYDEMRCKRNQVCGLMRTSPFFSWHLGRIFASLPHLNADFIECKPADTKRIFVVTSEPGLLVNYGNIIKAIRPLPYIAEPGLIDHN